MMSILKALWQDERGVTALEYSLIAGLIAAVLVAALGGEDGLGAKLEAFFQAITDQISDATDNITGGGEG